MLFSVGAVVMALCSLITVFVAREHQHTLKEGEEVKTVGGTFIDIYRGFRYMPLPLFLIGMLFFLSWFAYTPLMTNQTTYFVNNVYGVNSTKPIVVPAAPHAAAPINPATPGSFFSELMASMLGPEAAAPGSAPFAPVPFAVPAPGILPVYTPASDPAYIENRRGTQMGFYSLAIFAAVQFLYSLIAPLLVEKIGLKWSYFAPQLIATGCYIAAPFMAYPGKRIPIPAIIAVFALVAPNFVAFNSVPFALVSGLTSGASGGLYMGVLNAAGVVAQTATNSIVSVILKKTPALPLNTHPATQNVGFGIAFGGIASALACIWCVVFIRDSMVKKSEAGEVEEKRPLLINSDPETSLKTVHDA